MGYLPLKPKTPIRTKSIWLIKDTPEGKFFLLDETGAVRCKDESRFKMSNFAFDHGADEVRHEYDLVKYDGSGSQK